ncbi:MAG: hypothetical protein ACK4IT_08850 [Thioalkalivibrionaceae bacterium]
MAWILMCVAEIVGFLSGTLDRSATLLFLEREPAVVNVMNRVDWVVCPLRKVRRVAESSGSMADQWTSGIRPDRFARFSAPSSPLARSRVRRISLVALA